MISFTNITLDSKTAIALEQHTLNKQYNPSNSATFYILKVSNVINI